MKNEQVPVVKVPWLPDRDVTLNEGVYPPSEDTFLLINALRAEGAGGSALELCSGSGVVGLSVADGLDSIIAIDINPAAAETTLENYRRNSLARKVDVLVGDLFSPLRRRGFDLVIMNPPYLDDLSEPRDIAWSGGRNGRSVIDRFLREIPSFLSDRGRAYFLQTDTNGIEQSLSIARSSNLEGRVVRTASFMFEQLVVIRLAWINGPASVLRQKG
jgi:release factor glutamine methyltransferase